MPAISHKDCLVEITDFHPPNGWEDVSQAAARSRWACEQLELGRIIYFSGTPFSFPQEDRDFLRSQKQGSQRLYKNISYRPQSDRLKGNASNDAEESARLHAIMRNYSSEVVSFLTKLLAPYASGWRLDFASFRPQQEKGRDLPVNKRNDLLHVDSFPTRPTNGARILRCFTNINPAEPRIWLTTDNLPTLAAGLAQKAGLNDIARRGPGPSALGQALSLLGVRGANRSAYDRFMLRFHDYLKQDSSFQRDCPKVRLEFPPGSTWLCYTDAVPHAVLSGQFALEQTFLVDIGAMVLPDQAPIRVLERIAGRPLAPQSSLRA